MPANRYNNLSAAAYWWLMTVVVAADSVVIVFDGWSTKSVFGGVEAPELDDCRTRVRPRQTSDSSLPGVQDG
jgi:hypothetical protein